MSEIFRAAKAVTMVPGVPVIDDAAVIAEGASSKRSGPTAISLPGFPARRPIWRRDYCSRSHQRPFPSRTGASARQVPAGAGVRDLGGRPAQTAIFDLDRQKLDEAVDEFKRTGTVMVGDIATRLRRTWPGCLKLPVFFCGIR